MNRGFSEMTGVAEKIDYKANLDLMASLHPKRDNPIVIVDNTTTGKNIKEELLPLLESYSHRFSYVFFQDFILDEVPSYISGLGERDIIYLLAFNQDREGNFITYFDGVQMIRQYAEVPIYGSWDFYFGYGIIGGYRREYIGMVFRL